LDILAARQVNAFGGPARRLRQRDGQRRLDVAAWRRAKVVRLERSAEAAARTARRPAEHVPDDVIEAAATAKSAPAARTPETPRAEGEALDHPFAARPGRAARVTCAEALEAAEARLALGVDLTAVERLALVVFAEDLVGRIQLSETLRSLRIVLVGVGVQLLGELAVRALDVIRTRRLLHSEHVVGIAHRG